MPKNLKIWPGGCTITIYINPRVHISKCCLFWHPHLISFKIQMSDHSSDNSNRCQLLHRSKSFFIINPTPSIVRCEKPRATNRANEIKIEPSLLRFTCHTLTTRNETIRLASLLLVMGQVPMSHSDLRCSGGNLLFHRPTLSGQPLLQMSLALLLSGEAQDCSSVTVSA